MDAERPELTATAFCFCLVKKETCLAKYICSFALALTIATTMPQSVEAQTQAAAPGEIAKVATPTAPLVEQNPAGAAWTVRLEGSHTMERAAGGKSKALKQIEAERTNGVQKETSRWSDGTVSEAWEAIGLRLSLDHERLFSERLADVYPEYANLDLSKVAFIDVLWVTAANFVGETTAYQQNCYYFKRGGDEAWINVETRLPVVFKGGGETHYYAFTTPPAGPLTVPPKIQQEIERYTRALHDADRYKMKP